LYEHVAVSYRFNEV